ncbi:MAG: IS30 family transposase [Desulfobulbaceae bacterium]|nr:IS30 family transposase [Desulfobulbaceae bacterium]
MRNYTQLAREQRYQISALKKAGHSQTKIAGLLGVHKSTISRELKRNHGQRGYRPKQAHELSQQRQQDKPRSRISADTWTTVERLLRLQWSPEQISGWLKRTNRGAISHEWIYLHIYSDKAAGGDLHLHLRCQKKRRIRYGAKSVRGQLVDRQSIDDRPALVERRSRIGDWEVDTIIGKGHQQAIVSLTERKARLALLAKVEQKTAAEVTRAIVRLLEPHAAKVHTLTSDNGKEFAKHQEIAKKLSAAFYFAHPYSSWERGTNENMNGLVRQYFPKNCELKTVTDKEIQIVMHRLNNRPRKCLGYLTPNEVFFGKSTVALAS